MQTPYACARHLDKRLFLHWRQADNVHTLCNHFLYLLDLQDRIFSRVEDGNINAEFSALVFGTETHIVPVWMVQRNQKSYLSLSSPAVTAANSQQYKHCDQDQCCKPYCFIYIHVSFSLLSCFFVYQQHDRHARNFVQGLYRSVG